MVIVLHQMFVLVILYGVVLFAMFLFALKGVTMEVVLLPIIVAAILDGVELHAIKQFVRKDVIRENVWSLAGVNVTSCLPEILAVMQFVFLNAKIMEHAGHQL